MLRISALQGTEWERLRRRVLRQAEQGHCGGFDGSSCLSGYRLAILHVGPLQKL